MRIKFWGVRGSLSAPIVGKAVESKIKRILSLATTSTVQSEESISHFMDSLSLSTISTYGGNTTCIEIRDRNNELVIIDGGTGLRGLGNEILFEGFLEGKGKAHWLFTHTHWDHIQGIPFFIPLYRPGNRFEIHSSVDRLEERLRYQHDFSHFPVSFDGLLADKNFHYHPEGEQFSITDTLSAVSKAVRHPGGSFSYRFMEDGKKVIFASDAEFNLEEMESIDEYLEYFQDADLLIFDTQYTFDESLQKIDWGHSSASMATDIALKANVKKLVMFHHDPSYDDEKLDAVYLRALKYKEMFDSGNQLEIIMAYEGLEITV